MPSPIYDTFTLLSVLEVTRELPSFWLSRFPNQINFETPEIAFDKVWIDYRKLAPLVVPNVAGRSGGLEPYETISFKPAYVKQKDAVDPNMIMPRRAGEALGTGSMSLEQRYNAVVAHLLEMQRVKIANRNEWLAAQAIINGSVTLAADDYPTTTIDFRRHASLTGVLAGAAQWSQVTGNPMSDIKAQRINVQYRSGARVNQLVFGQNAWDLFVARLGTGAGGLRDMMSKFNDGYDTRVSMIADGFEGVERMGVISGLDGAGRLELFVNTAKYVDPQTNAEVFMQDQNTVVGLSGQEQGIRCFGAIKDSQARFQALDLFPKMWIEEDPAVTYLMTQSAPLMVPKQPNATFSLKVA